MAGDKVYRTVSIRNWRTAHEIAAVTPYRKRPIIERTINQLKRYRRIATRYEKLAARSRHHVSIGWPMVSALPSSSP